jgi:hypothetical protein
MQQHAAKCCNVPKMTPPAPYFFFLFPRLKSILNGKRFQDVVEIQLNMTRHLQAIPKQALKS